MSEHYQMALCFTGDAHLRDMSDKADNARGVELMAFRDKLQKSDRTSPWSPSYADIEEHWKESLPTHAVQENSCFWSMYQTELAAWQANVTALTSPGVSFARGWTMNFGVEVISHQLCFLRIRIQAVPGRLSKADATRPPTVL